MKMRRGWIAFFITALLLISAACQAKVSSTLTASAPAAGSATTESTTVSAGTSATAATDVDALIREKLQNHHSIDRIYGAHHTREEWNATLDRMIGYGANISEDEKKTIIDYLMSKQQ